jgi:hypothetical protein
MKNETLIVNLYGGPSTGKSSMMLGIASILKWRGIDAEIAPEYAKLVTWETQVNKKRVVHEDGTPFIGKLRNQFKVFGEQHDTLFTLCGNVDVIITDSPILMQLCYSNKALLNEAIIDEHKNFNTLDVFLNRKKPFNPNGRFQTEEQAKQLDVQIKDLLKTHSSDTVIEFDGVEENGCQIASLIYNKLTGKNMVMPILPLKPDPELNFVHEDYVFCDKNADGSTEYFILFYDVNVWSWMLVEFTDKTFSTTKKNANGNASGIFLYEIGLDMLERVADYKYDELP